MTCLARGIAGFILDICTFFLGIAGALLNWVILRAVFQFSILIGNSPGLLTAWSILRDIGNMLLLFGFIFIGLATILDLHTYTAKKTLPKLIIFAILMNFSLFAAEGIIDVSNGLTSVIYTQTNGATCQSADVSGGLTGNDGQVAKTVSQTATGLAVTNSAGAGFDDCAKNYGLASALMNSLGINSIFGITNPTSVPATALLGMAVLCLVASGVFLAAAIMLSIRAVMLTFLMVFAPLGFAGMAIPPLQGMAMQWWHRLINQAFFAPVFFLLIFVSISITNGLAGMSTRGTLAQALSEGNSGAMGVIMIFVLIIGFMLASLIVAKKMGAAGATFATNFGMKVAFGAPARFTNLAVGGTARGLRAGSRRLDVSDPQSWKGRGWNAVNSAFRSRALQRVESANFDLRRLPGVGAGLAFAGADKAAKADEGADFESMRNAWQHRGKRGQELDAKERADAAKSRFIREARQVSDPNHQRTDLSPESQRFLAGVSLEQLAAEHDLQEAMESVAHLMSSDKFDATMKSDKISDTVKNRIRDERIGGIAAAVAAGDGPEVRRWTNTKDLGQIAASSHSSLVRNPRFAALMTDDQANDFRKTLSSSQQQEFDVARDDRFTAANAATSIANMDSDRVGNLPGRILSDPNVFQHFGVEEFEAIRRKRKLTDSERTTVGAYLLNIATSPTDPRAPEYQAYLNTDPRIRSYWKA